MGGYYGHLFRLLCQVQDSEDPGGGGWLLLGHLFRLLCQVQDSEDSGGGGGGWLLLGHLFRLLCQVQDSEDSGGWWVVTTRSPLLLVMPTAGL